MTTDELYSINSVGLVNLFLPIGIILGYPGSAAPNDNWSVCDGKAISREEFSILFNLYSNSTQEVDGATKTLLEIYGIGDGSTTFNIPDYRECALVGAGLNNTIGTIPTYYPTEIKDHDSYYVGEFKDDQLQMHAHTSRASSRDGSSMSYGMEPSDVRTSTGSRSWVEVNGPKTGRYGTVTRGKRQGITYIIRIK